LGNRIENLNNAAAHFGPMYGNVAPNRSEQYGKAPLGPQSMELEALNPLEPQSSTKPGTTGTTTCRRAWYVASIASIASIFLLGLFGAGVTIKNHQLSGNVEALTGLATGSLCTATDCVVNFLGRNDHLSCSGVANSLECIETCCTEELHCTDLGAGYCTGLGFRNREVTLLDRGLRLRTGTCKGEQNCDPALPGYTVYIMF
jgi:hypothetical protein